MKFAAVAAFALSVAVGGALVQSPALAQSALAQSTGAGIGAPTSAAGGVKQQTIVPQGQPLPPLTPPAGPQDNGSSTSSSIRDATPGTGKFETQGAPCIGGTGFGSSGVQPGHKC